MSSRPTDPPPVRTALASDALAVATIHVQAWQEAYRGLMPQALLQSLSIEQRARHWHDTIVQHPGRVLVWAGDDHIRGWADSGPSRDPEHDTRHGELYALYVHPAYWGQGIGRALWLEAARRLQAQGACDASVWVLDGNERALSFYVRQGFRPDGAVKEIVRGGKALREVRCTTRL